MNDDSLLSEMVDAVMVPMADAFLELWERPGAADLLERWLDGNAVFVVGRDGIEVRLRAETHGSVN
jgi:hypothetical protein